MTPDNRFAILYPEGTSYLYVRGLATSFQGVATLVCSTSHRPELFVRKTNVPGSEYLDNVERQNIHEVAFVRDHELIPKLLRSKTYKSLQDSHPDYGKSTLDTMVFSFANGRTLDDLIDLPFDAGSKPQMCNAFAWKLLSNGLDVISYVHSEGFSHGDGHGCNCVLDWTNPEDKLPVFELIDYGCANDIRKQDLVYTCDENGWDGPDDVTRQLANDLDCVAQTVASILTRMKSVCFEMKMTAMENLRNCPGGIDRCLVKAWFEHDAIINDLMLGDREFYKDDLPWLRQHVTLMARQEERRHADYSWARPRIPSAQPRLFDSRQDLPKQAADIPGPFRIALIDSRSGKVLHIEATDFNLHVPVWNADAVEVDPSVTESLIRTMDMDGKEDVIRAAEELEAHAERPLTGKVAHLFRIDETWTFGNRKRLWEDDDNEGFRPYRALSD
jgi:hypothetical protein